MAPQVDPEQPTPLTLHATAVFEFPVTVAVNCCVFPATTLVAVGATETTIAGLIVKTADADFVLSAFDMAVTVTTAGVGGVAGAL